MSFRSEHIMSLAGVDYSGKTKEKLISVFNKYLKSGMHGLCFSPYLANQGPGTLVTEEQIRTRLEIIRPFTNWIRVFSCTDGNEQIPAIAKEYGLKVLAGAWLSENKEINEEEISNLIQIARAGNADLLAVGNEVLYREELEEAELLEYINRVKKEANGLPVGYVDAYYEFVNRPNITEACDVIYANCYPFWEGCQIDYSLLYIKDMFNRAVKAANGKRVIITETGWPSKGSAFESSVPSLQNAFNYFINVQQWAKEDNIELFYFSGFDELWKVDVEGDVGAFWGIWDENGNLKYEN